MKPVLPAFTGHVPAAFKKKFPNARLKATNWKNGFEDTYILNPQDSLFAVIGKKFLQTQTKLFGTNHLYSADTFNENEPPSDDSNYLAKLSGRLYKSMEEADPESVWVMQGWLFYSDRKFWKAPQIKALLNAVPDEHMILLDLAAEIEPVWKRTNAFYGKPWIWNMVHNFGGNISMFGRMDGVAAGPAAALHDPASGHLVGIGLTMEGIEQNPVIYELLTQQVWQNESVDLNKWLESYTLNRYGILDSNLIKAWEILRVTAYNGKTIRDGAESIITGRPTFDSTTVWTRTKLNYPPKDFLPAWDYFIAAAEKCKNSDGFQYDLVDITRQVLANYAIPCMQNWSGPIGKRTGLHIKNTAMNFYKSSPIWIPCSEQEKIFCWDNGFRMREVLEIPRRKKPCMSAMPGILSHSGEMRTVPCMSIPAGNGVVYSMISIRNAGRIFFKMTAGSLDPERISIP